MSTHLFRYFIHRRKWIKLYLSKLLPRVLGAIVVLTLSYYVFFSLVLYADYKLGPEETTQEESIEPIIDSLGLAYEASQGSLPLDSASILNPEQNPVDEEAEQVTMFDLVLDPVNVISIMSTGLIVYFIWSTIYFMFHYVESYNQTLKYEATINEIELNKLKSQLNPHFIFNALNSIRALVDEDPRKSKIAITQLSTILRNSLIMDKKRLIPFTEEMVTVKDYLALETIRFEERLQTDFKLHPESYRFEVPPLMVQTLVENAIKHGISNLAAGGEVIVETVLLKEEDKLAIRIHNSGQYVNGQPRKGTGYGIENTKQRLRLIFGQEASFSISNESADKVLTEVVIPVKP
ncbi:MAG: histidine kinase [Bacteroidota bacterium]